MYSSSGIERQVYDQPALIFYQIGDDEPSLINRAAAYLTGSHGMAHVELRFSCGESVSVFNGETVFLKKRGYSNTQYKIVALSADAENERKMYHFARQQIGKGFNTWGLRRALLPWPLNRDTDGHTTTGKWFCSELITCILQHGGMLLDTEPSQSSPNNMYDLAQASASGQGVQGGLKTSLAANRLAMQEKTSSLQFNLVHNGSKKEKKCSATVVPPFSSSWTKQLSVGTSAPKKNHSKTHVPSWTHSLSIP